MIRFSLPHLSISLLFAALLAGPIAARADEKTPLAQQMSGISKDFRALRKVINDPSQKDAALKLVKDMEDHATKAKDLEPAKTKDIPPADKDQFIADYKKQMDGLIADFQKLEQDVTAGDTSGATAMLDTLQQDKKEGHKKFNAEDEQRGGNRPPAPPAAQASPQASPQ